METPEDDNCTLIMKLNCSHSVLPQVDSRDSLLSLFNDGGLGSEYTAVLANATIVSEEWPEDPDGGYTLMIESDVAFLVDNGSPKDLEIDLKIVFVDLGVPAFDGVIENISKCKEHMIP